MYHAFTPPTYVLQLSWLNNNNNKKNWCLLYTQLIAANNAKCICMIILQNTLHAIHRQDFSSLLSEESAHHNLGQTVGRCNVLHYSSSS